MIAFKLQSIICRCAFRMTPPPGSIKLAYARKEGAARPMLHASSLASAPALEIVRRLQQAGHQAFFVGGCVRDWMLDLPVKDIDIATSAHPDQIAQLFERCKLAGAHFGVMLVALGESMHEVATFRAEGSYVDHRRPSEVRFGTLEEDVQRRDFTINAIYYDPVSCEKFDPCDGASDLRERMLRTVGDPRQRFEEDALRLMRAVRFTARYGLAIHERTREAILLHAPTLREISIERIGDELLKTLTGPDPGRAMHLYHELGLWPFIIPEVEALVGCEQPPQFHPEGDVFVHTALALDSVAASAQARGEAVPPELALAMLLHDIGKPATFVFEGRIRFPGHAEVGAQMAGEIGRRLRLPTRMVDRVVELVANHMRFMDVRHMKRSTLRRFLGMPDFDLHLALHHADCSASNGDLGNYSFCVEQRAAIECEDHARALVPPCPITGADLIALGLKPGPDFKRLLDAVMDEVLEGRITTRDQALTWITQLPKSRNADK